MTIKELIEILQTYPHGMEVICCSENGDWCNVTNVYPTIITSTYRSGGKIHTSDSLAVMLTFSDE